MEKKTKYKLLIGGIIALIISQFAIIHVFPYNPYYTNYANRATVYFIDIATNSLVPETHTIPQAYINNPELTIQYLLSSMTSPAMLGNISSLRNVTILDFNLHDRTLSINLSPEYAQLPYYQETLARGGLVSTLTATEHVQTLLLYVDGSPLRSPTGAPLGNLAVVNTIVNPAISPTATVTTPHAIDLYFVCDDISGLCRRTVYIDLATSTPIEAQILEELFAFAMRNIGTLHMPPETTILDINTIEHISYIDLSHHFDTRPTGGRTAQTLTIQAIVHTLTSLHSVDIQEVEFFIEGQKLTEYSGYVDIGQSFTRDESIKVIPLESGHH